MARFSHQAAPTPVSQRVRLLKIVKCGHLALSVRIQLADAGPHALLLLPSSSGLSASRTASPPLKQRQHQLQRISLPLSSPAGLVSSQHTLHALQCNPHRLQAPGWIQHCDPHYVITSMRTGQLQRNPLESQRLSNKAIGLPTATDKVHNS